MKHTRQKTTDMVLIGVAAALIAVCAWITIPVGAVPVTLQTMAVCLTAALLGWKRGTPAVLVYLLLGAVGVPVFSGFKGGFGVLLGATGGYLIGFLFTALIVGIAADRITSLWMLILAMLLGVTVCYAFGTAWFWLVFSRQGQPIGLSRSLSLCVTPFLIPDAVKIILAAWLTNKLKPVLNKLQR